MDLLAQIGAAIASSNQAAQSGQKARWLVALSGGPDSTALMLAMKLLDQNVAAAHVNHGLRGDESDGDEEFCRELCEKLRIDLYVRKLSCPSEDEATLRDLRYGVLIDIAAEQKCDYIATGHTLDDQVETLLFRLFRGTSAAGLQGIPKQRILENQIAIVRPMLTVRRSTVVSFLQEKNFEYRIDSSNLSNNYNRNYIRNELLPRIEERFGDIVPRIDRLRALITDDQLVLDELTEVRAASLFASKAGCPLIPFLSEPIALQRRIVAHELRERNIEVNAERVEKILETAKSGGVLTLSADWRLNATAEHIQFAEIEQEEEEQYAYSDLEYGANLDGMTIAPALGVALHSSTDVEPKPASYPAATAEEALLDLHKVAQPLVLRRRRPGDFIIPFGMKESVKLKRYLQTHRKSDGTHAGMPVVLARGSEVYWVPGVGLSESVRVTHSPTHRLRLMHLTADELPLC